MRLSTEVFSQNMKIEDFKISFLHPDLEQCYALLLNIEDHNGNPYSKSITKGFKNNLHVTLGMNNVTNKGTPAMR